jgi:PhzF family phenazine biosynthesis protein
MRAFKQVDVFTPQPGLGNALAVVLEGQGLSEEAMQRFARWTQLSETTFLCTPTASGADYRVRIFTPGGELPFAGHPTLGSCHAWLEAGGQPQGEFIVQECAVGLVRIRREGPRLAFAAPPVARSAIEPELLHDIMAALGVSAEQVRASQRLDNGPVWHGVLLDEPETVLALRPDFARLAELKVKVGIAAAYTRSASPPLILRSNREARAFSQTLTQANADLEVRAFVPDVGVPEDPVTGSLNASLAQWLMAEGIMPSDYLAAQGACLGRAGQVHLTQDALGQVWVGGESVTCIDGHLHW